MPVLGMYATSSGCCVTLHRPLVGWSCHRTCRHTASRCVRWPLLRFLQIGAQRRGLRAQQLDEDAPMAGLWQTPAAQHFAHEFGQGRQQPWLSEQILPILRQYRRPVTFRMQRIRIMPLLLIATPRHSTNIDEALRRLGPVPELRIMASAHVEQGRIANSSTQRRRSRSNGVQPVVMAWSLTAVAAPASAPAVAVY